MRQQPVTAIHLLRQDVWRWIAAVLVAVLPLYAFAGLYYISTGDYNQPLESVMAGPRGQLGAMLGVFVFPIIISVRVIGFRNWSWFKMTLIALAVAAILPSALANQLLPGSYIRFGITLVLLTISYQLARYVYQSRYEDIAERQYTPIALSILITAVVICVGLLLPIQL